MFDFFVGILVFYINFDWDLIVRMLFIWFTQSI